MPLTAQQTADVRRFAGYPQVGTDQPLGDSRDFAAGWVLPGVYTTLYHLLNNLSNENLNTLTTVYLPNLYQMETDLMGSGQNLDTKQAAVWVWNEREIDDRQRLFDDTRRRMCNFLGIPPGPSLGDGSTRIGRA